jgi:hypothetical protein
MAKRKRASLKDKSPETLGITQKQGKGIDVLFGGAVDEEESDSTGQSNATASQSGVPGNLSMSDASTFGDDDLAEIGASEGLVDELGLPVALEEPPDDLILASASAISGEEQEDPVNPATSPFTLPDLSSFEAESAVDTNDLSGILEEETLAVGEEAAVPNLENENELSGIEGQALPDETLVSAGPGDDLSGLVVDEDLAGLAEDTSMQAGMPADLAGPAVDSANDLSDLIVEDTNLVIDTPPPTTAAPINVPSAAGAPAYGATTMPSTGTIPGYAAPTGFGSAPPPISNIPPPSTATGAPSLSAPRPTKIEFEELSEGAKQALGAIGEVIDEDTFDPTKSELPGSELTVRQSGQVARDDELTRQVLSYIGAARRDALFNEILELHNEVAKQLSGNSKDASFALDTLRQANNYIIEDPREYDEALYRVTLVKTMLERRRRLSGSSYRLGVPILLYGILATVAYIGGFFAPINFETLLGSELGPIFQAIWFSGLAGGIGGAVEVLWRLYWRVSVTQDFDPQYLMYYLVKPILGFVLGLVMYFTIGVITALSGSSLPQAGTNTGFVFTILLGFIAGYRQEVVFDLIYAVMKKIAPASAGGGKKSLIPETSGGDQSQAAQ